MSIRPFLVASMLAASGFLSFGSNVTGTLPVTSRVVSACQFSISDYSFGNIDMTLLPSGIQATGISNNLSVLCTSGTVAGILVVGARDPSSGSASHRMKNAAGDLIPYSFVNPIKGQGNVYLLNNQPIAYTSTSGINPVIFPLEARFNKADVPSGNYSDVVTVTMTF